MSSTRTIATHLTRYSLLVSNESGQNMIDSNFWKLCSSIWIVKLSKSYLSILIFQGNETPRRRNNSETIATRYSRVKAKHDKQLFSWSCVTVLKFGDRMKSGDSRTMIGFITFNRNKHFRMKIALDSKKFWLQLNSFHSQLHTVYTSNQIIKMK